MVKKRFRGQKFQNDLINTAILLFLRDNKKSTTEIKQYLESHFGISTLKGVQIHLVKLTFGFLKKEGKSGMSTYYEWKKTSESFENIINFMNSNSDLIKKIVEEHHSIETSNLGKVDKETLRRFVQSYASVSDQTKYWYNTKYVKSFLNEKTIEYFTYRAYNAFGKTKFKNSIEFEKTVLGDIDKEIFVVLMHYSPSLVLYLVNLEDRKSWANAESAIKKIIMSLVLDDIMMKHRQSHEGMSSTQFGLQKLIQDSKLNGVELNIKCTIHNPDVLKDGNYRNRVDHEKIPFSPDHIKQIKSKNNSQNKKGKKVK